MKMTLKKIIVAFAGIVFAVSTFAATQINLTTQVQGVLPVAKGGTGSSTDVITPLTTGSANDSTARAAASTANTNATVNGSAYDSTARAAAATAQSTANTANTNANSALVAGFEGRSWVDVSASRAGGVTYTNSTGRAILVYIRGVSGSIPNITCNGVVVGQISNSGVSSGSTFIVPNGGSYSVALAFTMGNWSEFR